MESRQRRVALCGIGGLIVLAFIWLLNVQFAIYKWPFATPVVWAMTAVLTLVFIWLVSVALRGRSAGILIDSRNRVSLVRFQAVGWTVVVISALITLVGWRARNGLAHPLSIDIPSELLAAMGIVATSLVATPALLSLRSNQTQDDSGANEQAADEVAAKTGRAPGAAANAGAVLGWHEMADAQWMDMFRGEEVTDGHTADLSKVQQFLITVTLLAVYSGGLWTFFSGKAPLHASPIPPSNAFEVTLPILTQSFVWLLGISHAGYLVSKALPSAPNPAAQSNAGGNVSPPPPPAPPAPPPP